MMSGVGFSDVTSTHSAGVSHSTASATMTIVSSKRRLKRSASAPPGRSERGGVGGAIPGPLILGMAAQQPELQQRKADDHREQHPGHGRGGAEVEKVLEGRLVEVLYHRAG